MISSVKKQGLYEVSIGLGKESYEYENEWLNHDDRDFGLVCMTLSPSLRNLLIMFNTQRISGHNWIEPLASTMRIIIAISIGHPTPKELFIQKNHPLFSMMKFFKMKKNQNIQHSQFKMKKVSLE